MDELAMACGCSWNGGRTRRWTTSPADRRHVPAPPPPVGPASAAQQRRRWPASNGRGRAGPGAGVGCRRAKHPRTNCGRRLPGSMAAPCAPRPPASCSATATRQPALVLLADVPGAAEDRAGIPFAGTGGGVPRPDADCQCRFGPGSLSGNEPAAMAAAWRPQADGHRESSSVLPFAAAAPGARWHPAADVAVSAALPSRTLLPGDGRRARAGMAGSAGCRVWPSSRSHTRLFPSVHAHPRQPRRPSGRLGRTCFGCASGSGSCPQPDSRLVDTSVAKITASGFVIA